MTFEIHEVSHLHMFGENKVKILRLQPVITLLSHVQLTFLCDDMK